MTKEEILAMKPGIELDDLVRAIIIGLPYHQWTGKPSTDISAAWQVVDKMPPPFQIHRCLDETWWVVFGFNTWIKPHVEAKFAPEAICKAALLAKLEAK